MQKVFHGWKGNHLDETTGERACGDANHPDMLTEELCSESELEQSPPGNDFCGEI